jgi:NAD+ synthase
MSEQFRLWLAQLNPTVGDLTANADAARAAWAKARDAGADMIAFPEMFLTGYQLQDLVKKPAFAMDVHRVMGELAAACADGPAIGIGGPLPGGAKPFNAYYILQNGEISATVLKHHLPNYNVFDEKRLPRGRPGGPRARRPVRIGVPICEDAWFEDVTETLAETGAEILLVPNGSPYHRGKMDVRQAQMVARVIETGLPLGLPQPPRRAGRPGLRRRKLRPEPPRRPRPPDARLRGRALRGDLREGRRRLARAPGREGQNPDAWEADYRTMVLSLGDYMRKAGFSKALLGLSGGVDSALVAAIACDALGPENVRCVMLPSRFTSDTSLEDARRHAETARLPSGHRLHRHRARGGARRPRGSLRGHGARCDRGKHPVPPARRDADGAVEQVRRDAADHRQQVRGRGRLRHDLRRHGGRLQPGQGPLQDPRLRDLPLAQRQSSPWMKAPAGEVIPPRVIDKPPTAELRENQKDEDSLPPYADLDVMLEMLIDKEASVADVVAMGYDRETVKKIERLIYINEYKRFQSAPGTRLTERAFWLDRRYPIVNRWRDNTQG